jgi:hypothetical protein
MMMMMRRVIKKLLLLLLFQTLKVYHNDLAIFEKYNFFGKLCILCVDMYLHQMVYPRGFNQC